MVQVGRRERQMADQAANFRLDGGLGGAMWVAVEGERIEKEGDEPFFFSSGGEGRMGSRCFWFGWAGLAHELV